MTIRPNPETGPLHLALGDHAAGCLRAACASHGMPGRVLTIPDDLSHGPLGDGRTRLQYMRACFRGYDDWTFNETDAFAPWDDLDDRLARAPRRAVVVWGGDNVSESTFLLMACWRLKDYPGPVFQVAIPDEEGRRHVATRPPADLAGLFASRLELSDGERARLGGDFVRVRDTTGLLRRWEDGQIVGVPLEHYDGLLIASLDPAWTPAARVVGAAMGRCDGHNPMSDLFFSSRLQCLIDAGRVEVEGPRRRLRDYRVRLPPA